MKGFHQLSANWIATFNMAQNTDRRIRLTRGKHNELVNIIGELRVTGLLIFAVRQQASPVLLEAHLRKSRGFAFDIVRGCMQI